MPGALKFTQPITDDETHDVETLTVSEEGGLVRICLDSPHEMFVGAFRLTREQERELLVYLEMRRAL